jgi:hypothetical protein
VTSISSDEYVALAGLPNRHYQPVRHLMQLVEQINELPREKENRLKDLRTPPTGSKGSEAR